MRLNTRNTNAVSGKYIMGYTCGASAGGMVGSKTPDRGQTGPLDTHGVCRRLRLWRRLQRLVVFVGSIMGRKRRVDHNWFGDSLDGTLARFRNIERPRYGFFIDNTTDLLSQLFIFLGLGASPFMRFDVACLGLAGFYMISFFNLVKSIDTNVIKIGFYGIGPTEIRLGFICYNFLLLGIGPWSVATPFGPMSPMDGIVIITNTVVLITFLAMVWSEGRRLAQEEALSR
jgi:phosphatidylglycerophosphate synthase